MSRARSPWCTVDQLYSQVAHGDVAAFPDLYDQVIARVYATALEIVSDSEIASSLTFDLMVEVWRLAPTRWPDHLGIEQRIVAQTLVVSAECNRGRPGPGPTFPPDEGRITGFWSSGT